VPNTAGRLRNSYTVSNSQQQCELIEVGSTRLRAYDRLPAGEHTASVRRAGPGTTPGQGPAVADVQVSEDVSGAGGSQARPPFTLHDPAGGALLCSVRPAGRGMYDVYGADGAVIGRITRRDARVLPWPRRVRWSVAAAGGSGPLIGAVGTLRGWVTAVATAPLVFVVWLAWNAWALSHLLLGVAEFRKHYWRWSLPAVRTHWRGQGDTDGSMDFLRTHYRLNGQCLDRRLAYAQAVLHAWDVRLG
jgi:hypothetical protein